MWVWSCVLLTYYLQEELKPDDLVSPRIMKKKKSKDVSSSTMQLNCNHGNYLIPIGVCDVLKVDYHRIFGILRF